MQPIITVLSMFKKYNINPDKQTLPDCVARAISLATGADYDNVICMLRDNGMCNECDDLNVSCYSQMLSRIGYPEIDAEDKTVGELCQEHKSDTLLVRIEGHLTCCINGNCYDIWDCTEKKADKYWLVR